MKHKIMRAADYRRRPWKNGLGTTLEVYREPVEGDSFDWRVSIADLVENSFFSAFPSLIRVICTLEGRGMRLNIDGVQTRSLLKYDPLVFSGDSKVESELLDGPIRDFNLIFDPDKCSARLQWLDPSSPQVFCSPSSSVLLFALGPTALEFGEHTLELDFFDAALLTNEFRSLTRIQISSRGEPTARCCLIEVDRLPKS